MTTPIPDEQEIETFKKEYNSISSHDHSNCDCSSKFELSEEEKTLLDDLREELPDEILKLPVETQNQYLMSILRNRRMNMEAEVMRNKFRVLVNKFYKHKYPELLNLENWKISKEILSAVNSPAKEDIQKILIPEGQNIYSLDNFLDLETCKKIIEEVEHFEKWCISRGLSVFRPNSMNNYGAILDDFGFSDVLDDFMKKIVQPISKIIYPHMLDLDDHHGFIVEYEVGKDTALDFHVDDAEVTLNLCLGEEFKGGELFFGGIRCEIHQQTSPTMEEQINITHSRGKAIIHLGKHRHAAQPITSGHRLNLILWCRSTAFRDAQDEESEDFHPDWCKWDPNYKVFDDKPK